MKVVNVSGLKNSTLGKEGGATTGAAQLGANPLALGAIIKTPHQQHACCQYFKYLIALKKTLGYIRFMI